jgi:hypothetical protein
MSQTLTISDSLFARLSVAARQGGFHDIADLLEAWQADEGKRHDRHQVIGEIDRLRQRLEARYGEMPDSVDLISQDRAR